MIKRVKIQNGFMMENPNIKDRIFEFKPGLNIIVGNNGAHKSMLLKTIAAHCGIEKGGFSRISDPAKIGAKHPSHYPILYMNYAPGKTSALVEWDGTPSFYNDADTMAKNDLSWFMNPELSSDGISTEAEQLDLMATKPSSGEYRIQKINKIMQMLQRPPDLSVIPNDIITPEERAIAQFEVNYIQSLPRTGPMTVMLDEPEKALSLHKQLELFDTIEKLAEHFQVIMVSHSPFVLFKKKANFIDMIPNFSADNKKLIKKYLGKI